MLRVVASIVHLFVTASFPPSASVSGGGGRYVPRSRVWCGSDRTNIYVCIAVTISYKFQISPTKFGKPPTIEVEETISKADNIRGSI